MTRIGNNELETRLVLTEIAVTTNTQLQIAVVAASTTRSDFDLNINLHYKREYISCIY